MPDFSFKIEKTDQKARKGLITTAHGEIKTPAFMPVGTAATVKAMKNSDVEATGADIILGNVYHLMLRPTADLIEQMGGLHKFMNWNKPILTDSGGFQVMSLGIAKSDTGKSLCKISEEGAEFKSHLDGSKHMLSPEKSIEIQHKLGSDITMIFDQCIEFPATHKQAKDAMELSLRWAQRSKDAFKLRQGYGLFGIQQGGVYQDLREISSKGLIEIGFDGYAIGGLAVGEGQEVMFKALDYAPDLLPIEKPRYLMGVGKPSDIVGAVMRGVDMFDCVIPTRSGRTAQAFVDPNVEGGIINIRNSKYRTDNRPLEENCACYACKNHSRAYLHHLTKSGEILSAMLITEHNLFYYQRLMVDIRGAIEQGKMKSFAAKFQI
jgi:queuine tRNA-ribosyltransferase